MEMLATIQSMPSIFPTIILRVVPCGSEILSVALREERRLRVIENRVL
jgi:hypothetical protein